MDSQLYITCPSDLPEKKGMTPKGINTLSLGSKQILVIPNKALNKENEIEESFSKVISPLYHSP